MSTAVSRPAPDTTAVSRRQPPSAARGVGRIGSRPYRRWVPFLFISPFFVLFLAFTVYPALSAFRLSLTTWFGDGAPRYIGTGNYEFLLSNPEWWSALGVTALMWVLIVPTQILIALVIAVLLSDVRLRGKGLYRTAFIAPLVTPLVAMAQVWIIVFDEGHGVVNSLLSGVGITGPAWLESEFWAPLVIAALAVWKTAGFAIIVMLAGLQSINPQVYEAATLDGASWGQVLRRVTLPLMRRTVTFYAVIATLGVIQMFAEPLVITDGGPDGSTTTTGVYLYGFIQNLDFGTGAAASFLLVVLVITLTGAMSLMMRRRGPVR